MMKKRAAGLTTQTLLDFDLDESSSDSDFRIEDHAEESEDYSENSGEEQVADNNGDDDSESDDESESGSSETKYQLNENPKDAILPVNHLLSQLKSKQEKIDPKLLSTPICCACLGDRSDDANEIVECDGCGVTVHEGCYGVNDTASLSSTVSSCSTEPWFCEACKAGAQDPTCELCPICCRASRRG